MPTQYRILLGFTVFLASLLVTDCGYSAEQTKTLTFDDKGESVQLSLGDTLECSLPTSLGTGYSWYPTGVKTKVLRPKSKTEGPAEKPGAEQQQVFKFKAVGTGSTKLRLLCVHGRDVENGKVSPEKRKKLEEDEDSKDVFWVKVIVKE